MTTTVQSKLKPTRCRRFSFTISKYHALDLYRAGACSKTRSRPHEAFRPRGPRPPPNRSSSLQRQAARA